MSMNLDVVPVEPEEGPSEIRLLPTRLSYWLRNYNSINSRLTLCDGSRLDVIEDDVEAALGLPRGTIQIKLQHRTSSSLLFTEWKGLLNKHYAKNGYVGIRMEVHYVDHVVLQFERHVPRAIPTFIG
nr:uncharacterized protein LOC109167340 [Ipomoea trifida]GME07718.1 uncharacterized protein LOC109167340 [Ipomoea batatas]